jgi:hypothetical protein
MVLKKNATGCAGTGTIANTPRNLRVISIR